MKLKTLLLCAALMLGCELLGQSHNVASVRNPTCSVPKDELNVLTTYLRDSVGRRDMTVLVTSTEASGIDVDNINLQLAVKGQGTPKDARDDLKGKDKSPCRIAPISGISNVKFISRNEHATIFKKGWPEFRRRFGKNARIVHVSRVGFNSRRDLALFYSSSGVDAMAGSCSLYVYQLKKGKWVKRAEADVWTT